MHTICLHYGMHKTGTSSIQLFLARNHALLYDLGFMFIDINLFRKSQLRGYLLDGIENSVDLGALVDYVKFTRDDIVKIISFEGFCGSLHHGYVNSYNIAATLSTLFRFARIRVILYVRNPFSFIESSYCQAVKEGASISFQAYQEIFGNPFEAVARLYHSVISHFGSEMVQTLLYEPNSCGESTALIDSFMSALRVDYRRCTDWQSCNIRLNQGYSRLALEASLFINKRFCRTSFHRNVRRKLQVIDLHLAKRPLYMLNPSFFESYVLGLDHSLLPYSSRVFEPTLVKRWSAYGLSKSYAYGYSYSWHLADLVSGYLSIVFDGIGVGEPLEALSLLYSSFCQGAHGEPSSGHI